MAYVAAFVIGLLTGVLIATLRAKVVFARRVDRLLSYALVERKRSRLNRLRALERQQFELSKLYSDSGEEKGSWLN